MFRFIRRKNEQTLWAAWSREEGGFHRVSRAGDLVGLEQLPRRGLNIEVKPYGLAGVTQERDPATAVPAVRLPQHRHLGGRGGDPREGGACGSRDASDARPSASSTW